jgi:very-short-patch-repair endonuclease
MAGMDPIDLPAYAEAHHGLVTRRIVKDAGTSRAGWYRAVADGRFEQLHPGVARLRGTARTREQAIAAAVLAVPKALASHRSAAHLWGIPRPEDDPVELIVPKRTRSPELDGVIVHRPRDMRDLSPVLRHNITTTNVLRLLCDLGAVDPAGVSSAVGHVVSNRLASPVALRRAIDRHARRGRHGVPAFRDALEEWLIDGRPVDSVLETTMARLFETYALPPFEFHPRIAGIEVDFRIVGTPVVLECDGWEFHAKTRAQQESDAARDAHLAEHGHVCVRFTYHQIVRRPAEQARRIRAVVERWAPGREPGAPGLDIETGRARKTS